MGDMSACVERLRIDADVDRGVTSRVLDLLIAVDRFPTAINLHREGDAMTLRLELEGGDNRLAVIARLRQIPGVRRVSPVAEPVR